MKGGSVPRAKFLEWSRPQGGGKGFISMRQSCGKWGEGPGLGCGPGFGNSRGSRRFEPCPSVFYFCLSRCSCGSCPWSGPHQHFQRAGKEGRGDEENVSVQKEVSCRQGFRWKLSHRIQFSPSLLPYRCETTGRSHFPRPQISQSVVYLEGEWGGGKGRSAKGAGYVLGWGVSRGLRETSISYGRGRQRAHP